MQVDVKKMYLRYYAGHRGQYGHEYLSFTFRPTGQMTYTNTSNYKNDTTIRKTLYITPTVLAELHRIVTESGIMQHSDEKWPPEDKSGRQELEICFEGDDGHEKMFRTCKLGSLADLAKCDCEGLRAFYYLIQDLKCLVFSLIALHFKIKPI